MDECGCFDYVFKGGGARLDLVPLIYVYFPEGDDGWNMLGLNVNF